MADQDNPDAARDTRLEARMSAAQKSLLQRTAALSGRTLSEFVVARAQDAARRMLAEHESIRLSPEEQPAFVQASLDHPEPNAPQACSQANGSKSWDRGRGTRRVIFRPD